MAPSPPHLKVDCWWQRREKSGDDNYGHVQRLVREAVACYRARGYDGTITMSHTVGHFTESCSSL